MISEELGDTIAIKLSIFLKDNMSNSRWRRKQTASTLFKIFLECQESINYLERRISTISNQKPLVVLRKNTLLQCQKILTKVYKNESNQMELDLDNYWK